MQQVLLRSLDQEGRKLDLTICTRLSTCLQHLSLHFSCPGGLPLLLCLVLLVLEVVVFLKLFPSSKSLFLMLLPLCCTRLRLLGCVPSGRLWALRACFITSFTPFGCSGRVTHVTKISFDDDAMMTILLYRSNTAVRI